MVVVIVVVVERNMERREEGRRGKDHKEPNRKRGRTRTSLPRSTRSLPRTPSILRSIHSIMLLARIRGSCSRFPKPFIPPGAACSYHLRATGAPRTITTGARAQPTASAASPAMTTTTAASTASTTTPTPITCTDIPTTTTTTTTPTTTTTTPSTTTTTPRIGTEHGRNAPAILARYFDVGQDPAFPCHDFLLFPGFLTDEEEALLAREAERKLRKQPKYQRAHFDSVIRDYRESPANHHHWSPQALRILDRAKLTILRADARADADHEQRPQSSSMIRWKPVHILDLAETGSIGAHVDHVEVPAITRSLDHQSLAHSLTPCLFTYSMLTHSLIHSTRESMWARSVCSRRP